MTTLSKIKKEFQQELSLANSEIEQNMIKAEYNYRIRKMETEGPEAYELAYIVPNKDSEEDCGCGKD